MKRELANNIAFLPQNWDIEIYCPEDKISNIILNYYNGLVNYQKSYRGDIPGTSTTKRLTREEAKKQKEKYNFPAVDTYIAISDNIILKSGKEVINDVIPQIEATNITVKEPVGMENFKAYSLSFCTKLKKEEYKKFEREEVEKAWEKYSDDNTCGQKNSHFIFYITFHKIPTNLWQTFKNDYYRKITVNINNINYLNL